jgi:GGDEF domain-containing protein
MHPDEMTREQLIAALALAQSQINAMKIDPTYGILTRVALEASPATEGAIIFWDVDKMHDLNQDWGYEGVDKRIREACAHIRHTRGCTLIARWYSGDEFIYACPANEVRQAALNIVGLFKAQGIGVTCGVAEIVGGDWREAVRTASRWVQSAKAKGNRGGVHYEVTL